MRRGIHFPSGEELEHEMRSELATMYGNRRAPALVVDADRTLSPDDSGRMVGEAFGLNRRIRAVFEGAGYNKDAFARVAEIWSEVPVSDYGAELTKVATQVHMREVWKPILKAALGRVPVVIVSSGIPQVWKSLLALAGFPGLVVIGGCHPQVDRYLVAPETKASVVQLLQRRGWPVLAAGDSPIDLPMLEAADHPVFVPDLKGSPALREALGSDPRVRHFIVDHQRFNGMRTWDVGDILNLLRDGKAGGC